VLRYLGQHRLGAAFFILVVIGSIAAALYYLDRGQKRVQHLYVPKLLMVRVDEVPFPKGGKVPVDVMAGMPASITCENIQPPPEMGRPGYRFHVGKKTFEPSKCALDVTIPGSLESAQTIGLDYLLHEPGGKTRVIDHWEALVKPVPSGEYFRIRTFATMDRRPLAHLTVPRDVFPYVEAAVGLDGDPKDYAVLFFVAPFGSDMPALQVVSRPQTQEKFEVVSAELRRFRGFGPRIGGYAAWPTEPIQVGNPEDERRIFEVYAAIFEVKNVPQIVKKMLSFEGVTEDGAARIKVQPTTLATIKALSWRGWLSGPIRLVREANPQPADTEPGGPVPLPESQI